MNNKDVNLGQTQVKPVVFNHKSKNSRNNTEISQKSLVLMWTLVIIGYFLFVVQWYSIGNFSAGYNKVIGTINNPALNAMPNWTITLMRGVGSFLAGWLIVKIGHRYSVITVLSLMVLSFPFIIVISVGEPNLIAHDSQGGNYDPLRFGLFLFFRLFLAIGGTTLIAYTNSIIANMPVSARPKYMQMNQLGFNSGALFANIFFVFGLGTWINSSKAIWVTILSFFIVLIAIALVLYILFGKELVPRQKETTISDTTFCSVLKQSFTWKLSIMFIIWLVSVVFLTSSTMRTIIEQSPQNFKDLVLWNINNGKEITSMAKTTLSTSNNIILFSGYNWVWPLFICAFVLGIFVGFLFITQFTKTIYKRKSFMITLFVLGYLFTGLSLTIGYFGGYGNPVTLSLFIIFIFIAGIFLWSVSPIMLNLYQQAPQSSPKYAGIISGQIWGIGYIGYTIIEILLSVSLSFIQPFNFNGSIKNVLSEIKENNNIDNITNIIENSASSKSIESAGAIIVLVGFAIICLLVFIPISMLPNSGIKDDDGNFVPFTKKWNLWNWNFRDKDILIK